MAPHQQRVVDEKAELDTKLEKLTEFVANNPIFPSLPDDERDRLVRQRILMDGYSKVLGERIAAFPTAA